MNRDLFRLLSLGAMQLLLAPPSPDGGPDAGPGAGGGDSQAPGGDHAADAGALENDGDQADPDADGISADGDGDGDRDDDLERLLADDDEDEPAQGQRTPEDRIKRLSSKNRKLRRQLLRRAGVDERLKGVDLDQALFAAQQYQSLVQAARKNPRLRALLQGGDDDGDERPASSRRSGTTRRGGPDDDVFDEKALPFDPNANDANRYFANMARDNHELKRQLRELGGKFDTFLERDMTRTETSSRQTWGQAIESAAAQLTTPGVKKLFKDAMIGAYNDKNVRSRYSPQQLIAHYLKELGVKPQQAARAKDAARQRIAENNRGLPRHPGTGGTPAPARNAKENIAAVSKRLRTSIQ